MGDPRSAIRTKCANRHRVTRPCRSIGSGITIRWKVIVAAGLFAAAVVSSASAQKVIFVKIYVDEDELTREHVWKPLLTDRVAEASKVIARYADVRFAVNGYGVWNSDNRVQDFSKSLREFEQEVTTPRSRIAIGFSSQYRFSNGRHHLGGTRGPLGSHILIRENTRSIREPEKIEVLVHELGHFLAAAHSAESTSVMRPVVGDGQANPTSFQISFDPLNARIIRTVAAEMRYRNVKKFADLSPQALQRMKPVYAEIAESMPNDRTGKVFLNAVTQLLDWKAARPAATVPSSLIMPPPKPVTNPVP